MNLAANIWAACSRPLVMPVVEIAVAVATALRHHRRRLSASINGVDDRSAC